MDGQVSVVNFTFHAADCPVQRRCGAVEQKGEENVSNFYETAA